MNFGLHRWQPPLRLRRRPGALLLAAALASVVLLALPALAAPASSAQILGQVQRVVDGDTLWLQPADGGAPFSVRLRGIDAPEICQPWGPEARRVLADRALGREVALQGSARDDHGRVLATVLLDGVDLNEELVTGGHAWNTHFKRDPGRYAKQANIARALGRGLHAAGGAQSPREFRRSQGPCPHGG